MTTTRYPVTARRLHITTALAALVVAVAVFVSGCGTEESVAVQPDPAGTTDATFAVPTLAELQVAVALDADQVSVVRAALGEWRNNEARQQGPSDCGAGMFAGRMGRGGGMREFIADVAPAFDNGELGDVSQFVAQHRKRQMGGMEGDGPRARFGKHGRLGGPHGPDGRGKFLKDLGLTDEQRDAVRDAMKSTREAMRALREQLANDEITQEEFQEQAQALHAQLAETLQGILTDEQWEQWQAHKLERLINRLERKLENAEDYIAKRVDRLTRIVDLTPDQQASITAILEGVTPKIEEILNGLKDESITLEDARDQLLQIRKDTRDAVLAELSEEQLDRLEACHPVFPRPRR